jgi:3-dehydrosphinganine reductase
MWGVLVSVPFVLLVVAALWSFFRRGKPFNWDRSNVVVTGGSDGLGLAFAELIASKGAHVTVLARNASKLAQAKNAIEKKRLKLSQKIVTIVCDVSDEASVEKAMTAAGQVDVLVANAGLSIPKLFVDQSGSETRQMMNVNFFGAENAARSVLPAMRKAKSGRVVFVASAMSLTAFAGYAGYCASKWALRGFAECLQSELAPVGVNVQIFYAPTMKTPGLASENLVKPAVTHELEAIGDALEPAEAARVLVGGIDSGRFEIAGDLGAELLAMSSLGSPYHNFALRWILSPLLVPLSGAWRWHTRRIAQKHLRANK